MTKIRRGTDYQSIGAVNRQVEFQREIHPRIYEALKLKDVT